MSLLVINSTSWEMIFNATSGYYEKAIKFERAGNYTWFVVAVDGAGNNISSDKMLIEVPEAVSYTHLTLPTILLV